MFKETSRQGVQGVQDICLFAPKPHKQWEDTRELGNVLNSLRSTLVALLAENSLNSLSTKSK